MAVLVTLVVIACACFVLHRLRRCHKLPLVDGLLAVHALRVQNRALQSIRVRLSRRFWYDLWLHDLVLKNQLIPRVCDVLHRAVMPILQANSVRSAQTPEQLAQDLACIWVFGDPDARQAWPKELVVDRLFPSATTAYDQR